VKRSVYQRGSKRYYKFRISSAIPSAGRHPWIIKGGYDIERDACLSDSCLGNSLRQILPRDWSTTTEETDR
jgi:hypothetical protein